ncbi:hypothetical protein ABDK00_016965 [Niabella insulamsoli]|uniref:hypothetical protein n=1 Tax=Niabella insulamsoli TaxID=3144874 RepID=UPI0031FDAB36
MKKELTPEQMEKRKKVNRKIWLIGIAALILIGFIGQKFEKKSTAVSPQSVSENTQTTQETFNAYTYEQKQHWIKEAIKGGASNLDLHDAEAKIARMIKQQFSYPEEVNLENYPLFMYGDVVEADMGYVFLRGSGTAKNAFGVKSRFAYSVRTVVKPDTLKIDDVSVSEMN